jgi:hypothetical protein
LSSFSNHWNYLFDKARVIVALDADALGCGPHSLHYAREFAERRRVTVRRREMNRLYAVEPTPPARGSIEAIADHRLPIQAGPRCPPPCTPKSPPGWTTPMSTEDRALASD